MRTSELFTKTRKQAPADETAKNAQLLIQAGFIHKEMAGVYGFLPLGLMTLNNIVQVIREEMNAIGGQEVNLTALQPKELWEITGRWDDKAVDVWLKTKLRNGSEVGLGWTHEEALTALMKNFISSYKDLPCYPYQFQTKFRNELRAKSGIMRTREFLMKDMYSFSSSQTEHEAFYEKSKKAYFNVFKRLGLGDITYLTFASGGSFSKFSHEFQTITDVGEDTIYVHEGKKLAINKEVFNDEVLQELGVSKADLEEKRAVEVGNIFTLGSRFSKPLGLTFTDEDGQSKEVIMGCYGIGPGRVMGMIAEHFADERGLVWPMNAAPVHVYLVRIGEEAATVKEADKLYDELTKAGIEVLYDDRDVRAGEKFGDADLMGIPYRVVVSDNTTKSGKHEIKKRTEKDAQLQGPDQIIKLLADAIYN
jgi:prolyl-tRNA synthetase